MFDNIFRLAHSLIPRIYKKLKEYAIYEYLTLLMKKENRFYRLNTSAECKFIHIFEGYISRAVLACSFVVDVSSFLSWPKAISSFTWKCIHRLCLVPLSSLIINLTTNFKYLNSNRIPLLAYLL